MARSLRFTLGPRSIQVTPYGVRFLLITLAVGFAAINTGNNLLYLILAMLLSLIILSGLLSEQCLRRLEVTQQPVTPLYTGQPGSVQVVVVNRKRWMPTFCLMAGELYLWQLLPGCTERRLSSRTFSRRGRHQLAGLPLATAFPFGLFVKTTVRGHGATDVLIYPRIRPLRELGLEGAIRASATHEQPRRGQGISLHNLRDYHPGDEARAIHWKTSARLGQLIVKEHEDEAGRRLTLVLSNRLAASPPLLEAFEQAVEVTASLATAALRAGCEVEVRTLDGHVSAGMGEAQLHRILRFLALVEPAASHHPTPAGSQQDSLLILPWADPAWQGRSAGFRRVISLAAGMERSR